MAGKQNPEVQNPPEKVRISLAHTHTTEIAERKERERDGESGA
jgi:hypothetical protein